MPKPLYSAGAEYEYSDILSVGARIKTGGWGDERIELYGKLDVYGDRVLYIAIEEPLGLMFEDPSGAQTTCRGLTIRLSKENE